MVVTVLCAAPPCMQVADLESQLLESGKHQDINQKLQELEAEYAAAVTTFTNLSTALSLHRLAFGGEHPLATTGQMHSAKAASSAAGDSSLRRTRIEPGQLYLALVANQHVIDITAQFKCSHRMLLFAVGMPAKEVNALKPGSAS